jgi:hypothetical protein
VKVTATPARWLCQVLLLALSLCAGAGAAGDAPPREEGGSREDLVVYPALFFDRYQPNTALDMVNRVPGFQLDDGADKRGFGGAAGNILINDRRPSAKQDAPSDILARIPASNVARIELIRGQVRDIDLQGQSIVANIVLRQEAPAAVRWEVSVRKNFDKDVLTPDLSLSLSDRWKGIDYNTGFHFRRAGFGDSGVENVYNAGGALTEHRDDHGMNTNSTGNINFNAATALGESLYTLNTKLGFASRDDLTISHRLPQVPGAVERDEYFGRQFFTRELEVGGDAERGLFGDLTGKAILLFYRQNKDQTKDQRVIEATGKQTLYRQADTESKTTEAIARMEFDWAGWDNHALQANFEGAYNALDSALTQIENTGAGPVIVDVPGANSKVEEIRGDFLLKDTWSLGDFELAYGLGAETSTISQSGDATLERSFFFLKPQFLLTWSPSPEQQTRLRLAREVAQLDFNDFVSATVFQDNDLALGNPNLRPDATWIAEISHERRFGSLGVVRLTAYYNWISDVMDLLPLSPTFEAPGNIGNGRRWGVDLETTLPLDFIGLRGARFDIQARWQDSSVTDPVTGRDRVLSAAGGFEMDTSGFRNENEYALIADFRQDFQAARWAWGWNVTVQAERPLFKVNELDIYRAGPELNVFVETTRWFGMKIRIEGANLTDVTETRDRTVFTGERDLSPVDFHQVRDYTKGRRIILFLSGSF